MPKKDKYDLLASVIGAIYDKNEKVVVDTVSTSDPTGREVGLPSRLSSKIYGDMGHSDVWWNARSVKIADISMRKIPLDKGGSQYVLRTQDGEAYFSDTDTDFRGVWYAALNKYDSMDMSKIQQVLYKQVKNPKLKEAAGKGTTIVDKKSVYVNATEKMKSLGVSEHPHLVRYIKDKALEKNS